MIYTGVYRECYIAFKRLGVLDSFGCEMGSRGCPKRYHK